MIKDKLVYEFIHKHLELPTIFVDMRKWFHESLTSTLLLFHNFFAQKNVIFTIKIFYLYSTS